jgi:hypothetical protein
MLSNPPFGIEWKKVEDAIRKEAESARVSPARPSVAREVLRTRAEKTSPTVSSNHSLSPVGTVASSP